MFVIDQAEHVFNIRHRQLATTKCNGLVQQAETIPHASIGGTGKAHQRFRLRLYFFRFDNQFQVVSNLFRQETAQIEPQAARQDSNWNFLRIGRGQYKFHMRRRFFQCFQQRIKTAGG